MLKNKSDFAREKKRKTKNWREKIWSQKNKLCVLEAASDSVFQIKAQFTSAKESGQEEYDDHCLLDLYNNLQGQGDREKSILIKKLGIFYWQQKGDVTIF